MSGQGNGGHAGSEAPPKTEKYDLEWLMKIVQEERAYDESVKVRVTQEDIRRMIEKKRRKRK